MMRYVSFVGDHSTSQRYGKLDGTMNRLSGMQSQINRASVSNKLKRPALVLGGFVLAIWFIAILDRLIFDGSLNAFGVRPRSLIGLRGVLFMPFLHGGFGHLLANTLPFIILGAVVMLGGMSNFFSVVIVTMLVSGLGIWLFGSSGSVHIGASGLVFGFFGFILTRAYFERSLGAIVLAVVIFIFYGSIIWGVLPFQNGVSWLGHLFGFIGGAVAAYLLSGRRRNTQEIV